MPVIELSELSQVQERLVVLERSCFINPLLHRFLLDDVLINNAFDLVDRDIGVPDSVWPNQENRTFFADPQAVNFAS